MDPQLGYTGSSVWLYSHPTMDSMATKIVHKCDAFENEAEKVCACLFDFLSAIIGTNKFDIDIYSRR